MQILHCVKISAAGSVTSNFIFMIIVNDEKLVIELSNYYSLEDILSFISSLQIALRICTENGCDTKTICDLSYLTEILLPDEKFIEIK